MDRIFTFKDHKNRNLPSSFYQKRQLQILACLYDEIAFFYVKIFLFFNEKTYKLNIFY